jgi:hypothetical protein
MAAVSIKPNIPISSENIKIAQYFIIGVVLWFVVTGQLRKYRQAQAYAQAGTDPNSSNAIQVRQACNPSGVKLLIDVDGTWENDLMIVADQITNVNAVNLAYVNLYNENMFERLEKELNSTKFQEWMRRAQAAPTVTPVPSYSTPVLLYAINDTVVLSDNDSTKVAKRVKAGETIGTRIKAYSISNRNGGKDLYYLVTWTSYFFLVNQGLVKASETRQA